MEQETDSFKDYMYRGMGAFLKFTAKAGDSLRVASGNAIEKLDAFQLERKRERLYSSLGRTAFTKLSSGGGMDSGDPEVSSMIEEITVISSELDRRLGGSTSAKK